MWHCRGSDIVCYHSFRNIAVILLYVKVMNQAVDCLAGVVKLNLRLSGLVEC